MIPTLHRQSFSLRRFWLQGEPLVWLTAATLSATLIFTATLILIVLWNGLGTFWPARLAELTLQDGTHALGEITARALSPDGKERRLQLKVGNRDLTGLDFRWVAESQVRATVYPHDALALERLRGGNFYGFLTGLELGGKKTGGGDLWPQLLAGIKALAPTQDKVRALGERVTALNRAKHQLELKIQRLEYRDPTGNAAAIKTLQAEIDRVNKECEALNAQALTLETQLRADVAVVRDAGAREARVPLVEIVRPYRPNQMTLAQKAAHYGARVWELLTTDPREANTEGGLFPAIFGTVMMVFLMSLFCIPLGVIAAVYLREYAREGLAVRLVRIAVNNLAGVPSIVYGIFGLGFFVYGVGAAMDRLFYPERTASPTFGTGGLLWSSLTLALLTVPVVIVATEEALAAVPRGIREGSLALGATKFQTLVRILLPMASPGIMTGLILAMARAAGEVAPLMIVGVVKLAPALPLDGQFPYVHLERKFMHLGFHIYDVGFQSPNVEASMPMVYVTTLLLLLIVIVMSALAIYLRNSMKKKYTTGAF